ncbi:uncharacterized protein LOC127007262 isoform X2 [Eriocheir sinensis]|uniref:uncharacterized protein LOC127007262 isoform X2 n=1 Tax=Eriocheir sinensis TaxID=95602 RepID=UPI0021C6E9C7|nr:uncharacterized protein LOC127007262 isoform X2 [Eriocheir sinensis]
MMATCMVTCGRGLGNFVWQEILEKIPGTVDLRHLSEGKVAFKICHAVGITDTALMQGQKCVGDGGNLDDNEESREAKKEHNITSPISKELVGTKEMTGEEHTALQKITEPPGIPTEEEDQWVAAISHIYKLRLVERVFTLLHCEDIDSKNGYHADDGSSRPDDILKTYESKIKSLTESIKWNDLAVKLKRVKGHQDEGRSRPVWCQDPNSCPGSLRRRQMKQELGEKRAAFASSGEIPRSFPKCQREVNITGNQKKKMNMHETNKISDGELNPTVPNNKCKYESAKIPRISEDNIAENDDVHGSSEFRSETDLSNKTQHSLRSQKEDAKDVGGDHEETDSYEGSLLMPADNNPAKRNIDLTPDESKSPQSKRFKKNNSQPSQMNLEVVKKDQDNEGNSTEHMSTTFRVSSRVSGPYKNILTVKWINRVLGQQLSEAMAGWVPDWRQPLVDLYVNLTSSHYIVGAVLSPRPLSLRTYIPHLTLRSTICHLMARLSCLPPKAIVLDPMCGGGSILVETAMSFDVSHVIASDSSREQLEVARCNLHNLRVPVTLLQADVQELPLQDSSVNTVLCDFPFGQKHKLASESQQLLAKVLREMHRVLVCGGRAVFLLSPRQREVVSQLAQDRTKTASDIGGDHLILLETHFVSLGETSAFVAVLAKEHSSLASSKEEKGDVLS